MYKKGLKGDAIHTHMVNILGRDTPSLAIVLNWLAEFKRYHTDINNEARIGRPKTATNDKVGAAFINFGSQTHSSETFTTTFESIYKEQNRFCASIYNYG